MLPPKALETRSLTGIREVLYDLQVHQIEFEMENGELFWTQGSWASPGRAISICMIWRQSGNLIPRSVVKKDQDSYSVLVRQFADTYDPSRQNIAFAPSGTSPEPHVVELWVQK